MNKDITSSIPDSMSPFERIRRTNAAGFEYWSSRDFASILGYTDYRSFESVIGKASLSCFNSSHRIENRFVDITETIAINCGGGEMKDESSLGSMFLFKRRDIEGNYLWS